VTFNIALVFFLLFFFVKSSLQCATEIINLIDDGPIQSKLKVPKSQVGQNLWQQNRRIVFDGF